MKTRQTELYICEHCGKYLIRKHAMIKHELHCHKNPETWNCCSQCKYLEKKIKILEFDYEGYMSSIKQFYCNKLEKLVYPDKAVKKGLLKRFPRTFKDQIPMPKECEFKEIFTSPIDMFED